MKYRDYVCFSQGFLADLRDRKKLSKMSIVKQWMLRLWCRGIVLVIVQISVFGQWCLRCFLNLHAGPQDHQKLDRVTPDDPTGNNLKPQKINETANKNPRRFGARPGVRAGRRELAVPGLRFSCVLVEGGDTPVEDAVL